MEPGSREAGTLRTRRRRKAPGHREPAGPGGGSPSRLLREEHGLIKGFLVRTLLWFAVIALIGHDVGQIIWAQVQTSDAAHKAAQTAADTLFRTKAQIRAEQDALETVASVNQSIELKDFTVESDGSVSTTTTEEATTFIFGRVGFLKGFTLRHATAHEERSSF
jgi:hypothetical protein